MINDTKNRDQVPFFAFLDILGFSKLVKFNDHETLINIYKELQDFIKEFNDQLKDDEVVRGEDKQDYVPIQVNLICISDSIMLWTNHTNEILAFEKILFAVQGIMAVAIENGIPLRGAIVREKIEIIQNRNYLTIVGKGLTRAYELEKMQEWSGCIIDIELLKSLDYSELNKSFNKLRIFRFLHKTKVPCKKDFKEYYCVNWSILNEVNEKHIIHSFLEHNKRKDETKVEFDHIEEIIKNTIGFYKEINHCG